MESNLDEIFEEMWIIEHTIEVSEDKNSKVEGDNEGEGSGQKETLSEDPEGVAKKAQELVLKEVKETPTPKK